MSVATDATENKSQELMSKMDEMLAQAEELVQQTDEFYKEIGMERAAAARFLKSDKLSAPDRERAMAEMKAWEEEVSADIRAAQERFKLESRPSRRPAFRRQMI